MQSYLEQDTLQVNTASVATDSTATAVRPHEITPKEVLSWLPKTATPAQQDSAIQRHVKISEIHWSMQPDTLHMPGQPKGKSYRDASLPQYYRESFFSKDSLFHPELSGGRLGVAGDPIPYSIAGDNALTALLLACFVLAAFALATARDFIIRQAKSIFYVQHANTTEITETAGELWMQLLLMAQTCLLFSIVVFSYTRTYVSDTFVIEQYQLIGLYTAVTAAYFLLKMLLYWGVGKVFFESKKIEQWTKAFMFMVAAEGILLFPVVMLLAYFDLSIQHAAIYVGIVITFIKILSFFKTILIFFRKNGVFLQIILYLCALEIVPLALLLGCMGLINNILKVNF